MQYRISVRNRFKLKFRDILFDQNTQLDNPNRLEILQKTRQYHCRALCKKTQKEYKISVWNSSSAQISRHLVRTKFREIWVEDEFQTDILYCTAPQAESMRCPRERLANFFKCRKAIPLLIRKYVQFNMLGSIFMCYDKKYWAKYRWILQVVIRSNVWINIALVYLSYIIPIMPITVN